MSSQDESLLNKATRKPTKVISIRVDEETANKFDKLCTKHKLVKADLYSWALERAIERVEFETSTTHNANTYSI